MPILIAMNPSNKIITHSGDLEDAGLRHPAHGLYPHVSIDSKMPKFVVRWCHKDAFYSKTAPLRLLILSYKNQPFRVNKPSFALGQIRLKNCQNVVVRHHFFLSTVFRCFWRQPLLFLKICAKLCSNYYRESNRVALLRVRFSVSF